MPPPVSLIKEAFCKDFRKTRLGFQIPLYTFAAHSYKPVVGVSGTRTQSALCEPLGFVLGLLKRQNASVTRAPSHFNAVKSLSLQQGRCACLCTTPLIQVVAPLQDLLYRRGTFPFPRFVLQLLCFHPYTRWNFF